MFGSNIIISINRFSHPEGTILRDQIGSTPIVFTVLSANTSFIGTTLTIPNPIPLNWTRIQCNMDTLLLKITLGKLPCRSWRVGGVRKGNIIYLCNVHRVLVSTY